MRRIWMVPALSAALLLTSSASPAPPAAAGPGSEYTLLLEGAAMTLDASPKLMNGTMMVPLRNLAEAAGAEVEWNHKEQSVTAVKGDTFVKLTIGSTSAVRNGSPWTLGAAPVLEGSRTFVPLRFFSEAFGYIVKWDGIRKQVTIDSGAGLLPVVGSYDNLKKLVGESMTEGPVPAGAAEKSISADSAASGSTAARAPSPSSAGPDYSGTNVQAEGVDEADIVKTDGNYLYQVNANRVFIARASGELKLSSTIELGGEFQPRELYVDGNRLLVLGTSFAKPMDVPAPNAKKMIMPVRSGTTKVLVYDTADKTKPVLSREVELEGNYLSSRKVGSSVYLIANRFLDLYSIQQEQGEQPAPLFRDSAVSSLWESVGYDRIRYFPDSVKNSYLMVAGFDLDRPDQKADVQSYLGSGQNVYASADHLYVAVSPYGGPVRILPMVKRPAGSTPASPSGEQPPVPEQTTSLYKFRLDQGSLRFAGTGKVPGSVLNQFSMDERDGYFRIATTKGDMWAQGEQSSKNNVYVLDESLTVTGKLENLAPGERIYSVRFLGNRAYMVTFRQVDPLFAIDLSDPQSPKVLGSLKIPGYSDYLHPYDETHLIGFGKDTIETAVEKPFPGQESTQAFYQGMKLAMFDVSDVAHPVELFKEAIGDRGTDSELLHNHKALLFSKEKNLMAFPVTVAKINPKQTPNQPAGIPAYGEFAYQGAYVYGIDLQKGFTLKGKITHLTEEDIAKAGQGGGGWNKYINRILYSGTNLYTFSPSEIRSNDMGSLQPNGSLKLPAAAMPETGIPID